MAGWLFVFLIACSDASSPERDATISHSPEESQQMFRVTDGFRVELVASEPLISEPSGICWDEKGHLYGGELHGYNLEGQLEIEEMNRQGIVDTVVQRVQAAERFKQEAIAGTYGVVKRLTDTDGDGVMDSVQVFADRLPPVYGLCVARGGLIVAGQAQVLFIKDADNDGRAEIVDTLFKGFAEGPLERGISAPQWRSDGWIYFANGLKPAYKITGPYLKDSVDLPNTNFRIRADGTAIEAVTGSSHTIGHAFTASGESFFTSTWKHALYAIPIGWKYLQRNPDAVITPLEADAADYADVFPLAPVHPWKLARSGDAGWRDLYGKYGRQDSVAEGYFTSVCSPLVYQDNLFPSDFVGNLFICEPAQSRSASASAGGRLATSR